MSPPLTGNPTAITDTQPKPRKNILSSRLAKDLFARRIVTTSGFAVIFVILAIFFVIAAEVLPLFQSAEVSLVKILETQPKGKLLTIGTEEYKTVAYTVDATGIQFHSLEGGTTWDPVDLPDLSDATITSASDPQRDKVMLGLSDGRIIAIQIIFDIAFHDGQRSVTPRAETIDVIELNENGSPVTLLAHHSIDSDFLVAGVTGTNQITAVSVSSRKNLMGNGVNNYTHSVSLRRGTLFVELTSSVLREELSYGKLKIIKLF